MNSMAILLGERPIDEKMPISLTRSNTEPSIVLRTIKAAIKIGMMIVIKPCDEVAPMAEKRWFSGASVTVSLGPLWKPPA